MTGVQTCALPICSVFEFKSLSIEEIKEGILLALKKIKITTDKETLDAISKSSNGDMRKAINNLDFIYKSLPLNKKKIELKDCQGLFDKANIRYDRGEDAHFDTLSSFMKSLRGSDADASIFYLAKLLEGGDLIAACRRLLCSVSEDVGLAYPQLIPIVKSCVDSALQLGMPEAQIGRAHV